MSGHSILGNFKAYKTGHDLNNRLLRALLSDSANYQILEFTKPQEGQSETIDFLDTKKIIAAY